MLRAIQCVRFALQMCALLFVVMVARARGKVIEKCVFARSGGGQSVARGIRNYRVEHPFRCSTRCIYMLVWIGIAPGPGMCAVLGGALCKCCVLVLVVRI